MLMLFMQILEVASQKDRQPEMRQAQKALDSRLHDIANKHHDIRLKFDTVRATPIFLLYA
jgi:hypothetical protein